jgi:hypothetical protein
MLHRCAMGPRRTQAPEPTDQPWRPPSQRRVSAGDVAIVERGRPVVPPGFGPTQHPQHAHTA